MASIVLGVGGGIAAYKSCEVLRRLSELGHTVRVIPTASALHFVGAATFEALSGFPVSTQVWDAVDQVQHVRLGQQADLVLIVPATADLLARAATGRADDLLTATLLAARCPVVMAPAMHTEMWEHPATVDNVATLRRRGTVVLDPAVGRLTGQDSGVGRLPEPADIASVALTVLQTGPLPRDLQGRHVVVSSGGTREALDPVRFLGNRSSGRQGHAVARAARLRGAHVTLVACPTTPPPPAGCEVVNVTSAAELGEAMVKAALSADVVVMAAAVADFRPAGGPARGKVKKSEDGSTPSFLLERTTDVLAMLAAQRRPGTVLVGFAAETEDLIANASAKLARKGADLLVVNQVGDEARTGTGFDTEDNAATILGADGSTTVIARSSKDVLAHALIDAVVALLR
jgi:phosphopantothenoylcysteine decarboxylase/phosphopantothenate--cysteine ligase